MNSRLCRLISMNEIHIFSSLLITLLNFDFNLLPIFSKDFQVLLKAIRSTIYVSVSFLIQISDFYISVKLL